MSVSPSGRGPSGCSCAAGRGPKSIPARGWRCCESWRHLPVLELLGGHGASVVVALALCLPTDGAALGAEVGTAQLKPGQCLSAAETGNGCEKPVSWRGSAPAGWPCQPGPIPITSCRPAALWLPFGQGREGLACPCPPALPGSVSLGTARNCFGRALAIPPGVGRGCLAVVPRGS